MSNNNNMQTQASSTFHKDSSLDFETKDVHAIKYKMSKAKERCMTYFRSLNSHLQVLSKEDLKGTRIEHGFKRAFMSLFDQDADTFRSTMLLNVDHLQKQLDKAEFQEDGSMTAFWGVNDQFQKFIDSQVTLDYDSQMTEKYFVEYTGIETHESTIDMGKVVHADLVVTESNEIESKVQVNNSRSGNDTDADDAVITPIYDEEPMAKVQLTAECNIFAIGQQHTEQPEIINDGRVDQVVAVGPGIHDNSNKMFLVAVNEGDTILLHVYVVNGGDCHKCRGAGGYGRRDGGYEVVIDIYVLVVILNDSGDWVVVMVI
nr:hypothetical protein [Tanacetum cinerariifolium]